MTVVKKGTISATTAEHREFTASLTGLDDLTAYSVYVVMEDQGNTDTSTNVYATTAPNLAATPSRAWFTTADGTPPEFTGEYTPAFRPSPATHSTSTSRWTNPERCTTSSSIEPPTIRPGRLRPSRR